MTTDEIKDLFKERQVQKIKLAGFDIDGILRGKYISADKFFSAIENGLV